jgi:hypothetical protein
MNSYKTIILISTLLKGIERLKAEKIRCNEIGENLIVNCEFWLFLFA